MKGAIRSRAGPRSRETLSGADRGPVDAEVRPAKTDLLDGFEERGFLGQGATGTVVRAFDRVRRQEVALKYLDALDPDSLYRFKQEFRVLTGLVHPNIVTLYSLALIDGHWVVTMELVEEARSFLDYVRPYRHLLRRPRGIVRSENSASFVSDSDVRAEPKASHEPAADEPAADDLGAMDPSPPLETTVELPTDGSDLGPEAGTSPVGLPSRRMAIVMASLDLDRLYDALRQLVDALDTVHQRGILHRDIKPSNVLVDKRGRVVVCDFGLAMPMADATRDDLVGTPAYMSPEQSLRGRLSLASDYYSVGVMLYEALTGHLPFDTDSLSTLLVRKRQEDLLLPRQLNPHIPVGLESLCVSLLEVHPDRRPDAAEIRAVLDKLRSTSIPIGEEQPLDGIPLMGRARERTFLRRAFADARAGSTVTVLISGSSGLGKSALAATLGEELSAQHDALLLRGRCYRAESVPFKAVDAVVDALAAHLMALPVDLAESLMPEPAAIAALCEMFPVLRRAAAVARVVERHHRSIPAVELRPLARVALGRLVRGLASRRPVVIVIDDLQWGDLDSEPLLREIIQGRGTPGALVLVTYRDEAERSMPPLVEALTRPSLGSLGVHLDVRRLVLEPLGVDEAEALIRAAIGPGHELSRKAIERAAAAAAGHPMLIIELAHALRAEKSVVSSECLDDLIEERIEALPHEARLLLEAVATTAWPQSLSLLASALGISQEASTLALLLSERMVCVVPSSHGERITTYHDRIRETAVERLSGKSLRRLHRKLAAAFERSPEPDFEALAHHWAGAREPRRAAHYTLRAGEQAMASRAYGRAADHFSRFLRATELSGAKRRDVQVRHAKALYLAGRLREAAEVYGDVAEHVDRQEAARLRSYALVCMLRAGEMHLAEPLIRASGRDSGVSIPTSKLGVLASVLWGRVALAIGGIRIRKLGSPDALAVAQCRRLDMAQMLSMSIASVHPMTAFAVHTHYLRGALRAGDPLHLVQSLGQEAVFLALLRGGREKREVRRMLGQAQQAAEASGQELYEDYVEGRRNLCDFIMGMRMRDAAEAMDAVSLRLRHKPSLRWESDTLNIWANNARGLAGSFATLSSTMPALLARTQESGNDSLREGLSRYSALYVYLAHDRPDLAEQLLDHARPPANDNLTNEQWSYRNIQAEIDAYCQRWDVALQKTLTLMADMKRSSVRNIPLYRMIAASEVGRRSAVMAARGGDDREAHLRRARTMKSSLGRLARDLPVFASGHAALVGAVLAVAEGRTEAAVEELRVTIECFDSCQAGLHAMPARRELGRLLGGSEGQALVDEAHAWMDAEGVANKERFICWQCPVSLLRAGG